MHISLPISNSSIQNFFFINGSLICIALIQYSIHSHSTQSAIDSIFVIYLTNIIKNYFLINIINHSIKNKKMLNSNNYPLENYKNEFHVNVLTSTFVETGTSIFINNYLIDMNNCRINLFLFLPLSFAYELSFDFFHYWIHRLSHENKYLYQYFHKKHHKYNNVNSYITFYQSPFDLLLSNSLPQIISICIFPFFSGLEYELMRVYLTYEEISGHNGRKTYPTSCFTQFIWVPRWLNIELYSEDHYLHHSLNNCNYSKRFSLWDKVFNTYTSHTSKKSK